MNDLDMFRGYLADHPGESPPVHVWCATVNAETRRPCPSPAVRLIFTACIHEHVGPTYQCAAHSGGREMRCQRCWDTGHVIPLVAVPNPPADVDEWLIERINPLQTEGLDMAEWRDFVRENLHWLIPDHLRLAS